MLRKGVEAKMSKKYNCPYCHEKEVEEILACGSASYFCDNCKKLVSSKDIKEDEGNENS